MSPTVLRVRGYRFFFFSKEEARPHIHVHHGEGEAKVWLAPRVELARQHGLSPARLVEVLNITEENHARFVAAWSTHFGR